MAKAGEVLAMLIPNGGWYISGDNFDSIRYDDGVTPITRQQFEDGFSAVDALKNEQASATATAKAALLDRLGISAEEAKLLLS